MANRYIITKRMVYSEKMGKKFLGSLLGAAIGDALGASREGRALASKLEFETMPKILGPLRYTDDTHMTIGVAESLVQCSGFDGAHMARCFVNNYLEEPWRGYAPGPPIVFSLLRRGAKWDKAAADVYPGGSFGNGAAMRVAPIGLLFWENHTKLKEIAYQASLITHSHILGREGAALQSLAVALAVAEDPDKPIDVQSFILRLLEFATEDVYRSKIARFPTLLKCPDDREMVVEQLGHGVEAFESIPTAIFAFLANPQDFVSTVIYAVSMGGDTDTIASMAGAISGAYLGIDAIPSQWQEQLENRDYISQLAVKLWQLASAQK